MKIIHQIWLGNKSPPKWCMDSWKDEYIKYNSDWKYILWTDKEANELNMINKEHYKSEKNVRGKADILRYEILYQYGGIFIDADSLCINIKRSLNELLIDNIKFFACREPKNKQYIANGVIYCNKNNNVMFIIKNLNCNYVSLKKKYPKEHQIWLVTNQPMFTNICENNNIKVYDSDYFYPEAFIKNNINISLEEIRNKYNNSFMFQYWLSHYN